MHDRQLPEVLFLPFSPFRRRSTQRYDRDGGGGAADIAKAQEFGGSRITYLPAAKIAGATGKMARAAELYEAQLATDPMDGESLQDLGWFVYFDGINLLPAAKSNR